MKKDKCQLLLETTMISICKGAENRKWFVDTSRGLLDNNRKWGRQSNLMESQRSECPRNSDLLSGSLLAPTSLLPHLSSTILPQLALKKHPRCIRSVDTHLVSSVLLAPPFQRLAISWLPAQPCPPL